MDGKLKTEHLDKIKYRFNYKINESITYRQLSNEDTKFDEIPVMEADNEHATDNNQEISSPVPEFDKTNGDSGDIPTEETPIDNVSTDQNPSPEEQEVDELQNEIIKHNISAMKSIYDQLENLNNLVNNLNGKVDVLNSDVDEVREPTNSEKLMNKTNVSYPYYFNLNDLWSKNWFNEKRAEQDEKGVRELSDGTFIADFDDLPQHSKMDIEKSFNY